MLGFFLFRFIYFVVFLISFCTLVVVAVYDVVENGFSNVIFVNTKSEFVTALKSEIKKKMVRYIKV